MIFKKVFLYANASINYDALRMFLDEQSSQEKREMNQFDVEKYFESRRDLDEIDRK